MTKPTTCLAGIITSFGVFAGTACLSGEPEPENTQVMVKSKDVVFYSAPDESSAAMNVFHGGNIMIIVSTNGDWVHLGLRDDGLILRESSRGRALSHWNAKRGPKHLESFDVGWVRVNEVVSLDSARVYFSSSLTTRPMPFLHLSLATCCEEDGDVDKAIDELSRAIRLDPDDGYLYYRRAVCYSDSERFDQGAVRIKRAIDDLTTALHCVPRFAAAFLERAYILYDNGRYAEALADLNAAHKIDPEDTEILNEMARLHAACPDDDMRDGAAAVGFAKRAIELTGSRDPECLEAMAAGLAEQGDFDSAVMWQSKAIELWPRGSGWADDARAILRKYVKHMAIRDTVAPPARNNQ